MNTLMKLTALVDLFRKGQMVANPEKWKNRQVTATVLGTVIVAGANTATAFGYPFPVDMDTANTIALGLISVFNTVMTYITSEKVGIEPKVEVSVEERSRMVRDLAEQPFGGCDLADEKEAPEGLQEPIAKTKDEQIMHCCFKDLLVVFEGTGPMDSNGNFLSYIDPVGIPTIAWGITFDENGNKVKIGEKWSYARAYKHKQNILKKFLSDLYKSSPILKGQSVRRVAAVLSWVYNLGIGNYNSSTFKKRIDSGDWNSAASECKKWNKGRVKGKLVELKGLTRRRQVESDYILDR